MSKETCAALCGKPESCKTVQSYKAQNNPGLDKDLDCYGCGATQTCYDLGLLPKFPDCMLCEMNPKKMCVSSTPVNNPLGFGPGAIPLPKTVAGEQCWDCVDRPPICADKFPGSSSMAACQANCKKNDEQCVQVGVNPADGMACFSCQKKIPPPQTCKDLGFLNNAQCNSCAANQNCVPAGVVAKSGEVCFQCVNKPEPPNPPKEKLTCEDYGWQTPPCSECADYDRFVSFQGPNLELQCCKCLTNPCQPSPPNMHITQCQQLCETNGGQCVPRTHARGEPDCYYCSMPQEEPQTCDEMHLPDSCDPSPCSEDEKCSMQPIKLKNGKTISCAECEPKEEVDTGDCAKFRKYPHCAYCYRYGMSCKMEKVSDKPLLECAQCYHQCADQGAFEGDCSLAGACPENQECSSTEDGCHICKPKRTQTGQTPGGQVVLVDPVGTTESVTTVCQSGKSVEEIREEIRKKFGTTGDIAGAARALVEEGKIVYDQKAGDLLVKEAQNIAAQTGRPYKEVYEELKKQYIGEGDDWMTATRGNCYEFVHLAAWLAGGNNMDYRTVTGGLRSLIDPNKMHAWDGNSEIPAGQIIVGCSYIGGQDSYNFYHTAVSLGGGWVANNRGEGVQIERIEDVFGTFYTNPLTGRGIYFGNYSGYNLPSEAKKLLKDELVQTQEYIDALKNGDTVGLENVTMQDLDNRVALLKYYLGEGPLTNPKNPTDDYLNYSRFVDQAVDGIANHKPFFYPKFAQWQQSPYGSQTQIVLQKGPSYTPASDDWEKRASEGFLQMVEGNAPLAPELQSQTQPEQAATPANNGTDTSTGVGPAAGKFDCRKEEFSNDPNCDGQCKENQYCSFVFVTSINGGGTCYRCYTNPSDERCNEGYAPGKCYEITCSTEENCVENTKPGKKVCHKCEPKSKTTTGIGTTTGATATGGGLTTGGAVAESCPEFSMPGSCYGAGGWSPCPGQECKEPKPGCYQCMGLPPCKEGFTHGYCSGSLCDFDQKCIQDGGCYRCEEKSKTSYDQCDFGFSPGTCPGNCISTTENCVQAGNCYTCERKPQITTGGTTGGFVTPGESFTGGYDPCYPNLYEEDCDRCEFYGGECVPAGAPKKSMTPRLVFSLDSPSLNKAPQCYKCVEPDDCENHNMVCSCMACRPGTICAPSGRLENGKMCYQCIRPKSISVTYIIIIIETPYERFVLKNNPAKEAVDSSGLGNFVPSKVMALASVDSSDGGVQKIAGLLKGGVDVAGIVSAPISLESLTGTLKKGLSSGGKYTENCFNDFKETDLPKNPPGGSGGGGSSSFGRDPMDQITTSAPVVVCGQKGSEKALAIFDASGRPVAAISKTDLAKNPKAVEEALSKAQELSDQILEFRANGLQGVIKNVLNNIKPQIVSKVKQEVKEVVDDNKGKGKKKKKGKEEPKEPVVPNDPLYMAPEKEKQGKLLGIFGSSTAPVAINTGTILKFGDGALGDGSGVDDAKKQNDAIADQWGIHKVGYLPKSDPNSAWNIVDGGAQNVLVAVIDSGLDMDHPDAPEYIWTNEKEVSENGIDDDGDGYVDDVHGWNFLDNNNDLRDLKGHGTFVAGIIAAKTNNGIGVAGINPGAVIMPLKVVNKIGETDSFSIFRAIHFAVDHGARVLNISLGGRGVSKLEQIAINYARSQGVFVAVAAGNVGENISDHGPASSQGVFAVGAIDFNGNRSTISNWGPNNGLLAPGEAIYSLFSKDTVESVVAAIRKTGYWKQSGTSFSTPIVAATASLMLAKNPNLTPLQIEDILSKTATEMYDPGWDAKSGAGLLNATQALGAQPSTDTIVAKITAMQVNNDPIKKQLASVDVFGTVHGPVKEFFVEVGKGKHPGRFEKVSNVFDEEATNNWLVRIGKDFLRGSKEWVIRINVMDNSGQTTIAESNLLLK